MVGSSNVVLFLLLLNSALSVKVKLFMHSEQDESKMEDEDPVKTDAPDVDYKKKEATILPFLKHPHKHTGDEKEVEDEKEPKATLSKAHQVHPNEMIFPLIYRQSHINSMFKFGENWYTWSIEKRTDGSKVTNYYICYDEPKHCDDVGWERTDSLPKCAFEIDFLMSDDRACTNSFGVEPHSAAEGVCDGTELMKVSDIVQSCGPRIRSLWRFFRVGRRPANAAKPADVNSLVCDDEEECFVTLEYRIHHDRITFSIHEPTHGQTYKSVLKRDTGTEEDTEARKTTTEAAVRVHVHKPKKHDDEIEPKRHVKKFRTHAKSRGTEGKGVTKDRDDSTYRRNKNKIKIVEEISEDTSE